MKKGFLGTVLLLSVFLLWCTKKIENPIIFDDYKITLETKYRYQEITPDTTNPISIVKQYIQQTETGFVGSLIIAKTKLQTGINIDSFWKITRKSITRKISWVDDISTDYFRFKCWEQEINGFIQKTRIEELDQKQYLNQAFFSNKETLFWISTMTTDKKESKNLAKSIKNIGCPSTQQ